MAEYLIQGETLTAIADAIREYGGDYVGTDPMTPAEMIGNIMLAHDKGFDNGYEEGYDLGYADGVDAGGGSGGSYDEGYAAGEAAALAGYVDWNMMTTSNSCYIYFCNNHPTRDVFIHFEIYEYGAQGYYRDEITIAPFGEYEWTQDEMGLDGFSGGEWDIVVHEMRFI